MVKAAVDYTNRTGRDGMQLSPLQLDFARRVQRDEDRRNRMDMAEAVAVAMSGKKEAWDELKK